MRLPFGLRIDFARAEPGPKAEGDAKPPTGEIGAVEDPFLQALGIDKENPDQQIQHFGLDWMEEHEIKDCQYRNCLRICKAAVLARKIDVEAASEEPVDKRAADLVRWNIENIMGTFKRDMREALDAISKGYSVQEIIWDTVPFGDFKGRAYVPELRHKPPQLYSFETNRYGRVEKLLQATPGSFAKQPVPLEKFIVWAHDSNYENPYGRGLMSSCAWPIWFKKNGVKFWNIFVEKFAIPTVTVEMPKGATPSDNARIDQILNAWQTNTGIKIPEGFKFELMEAIRRGDAGYERLLDWCDKQISYAVLGVVLATSPGEKGTYGLGKAQIKEILESKIIQDVAEELEDVINEQFVRPVVDYNYRVERYPTVKLRLPKSYADLDAETLRLLLEAGLEPPVAWAREYWGIPEAEDGEEVLTVAGVKVKGKDQKPEEHTEETVDLAERPQARHDPWTVNFTQEAGRREDGYVEAAVSEINPFLAGAMDDYLRQIEASGIFETKSMEALAAIKPDYVKVQDLTSRLLYVGTLAGITDAQRLLWHHGWRPKQQAAGGAVFDEDPAFLEFEDPPWRELPGPEEALRYFSGLQKVTRDVYDFQLLNGNAFTIAWAEETAAVKAVHGHVMEALANGWTFKEFRAALTSDRTFMDRYSPPAGTNVNAHWETVFRTNLNSAYNKGRVDFYNDPTLEGYVLAYRYNAILDDRNCGHCAAMDGRVFAKDSAVWAEWVPPNHFSCRCYLDPITATAYAGDSKKPAFARTADGKLIAVSPDKGFGKRIEPEPVPVRLEVPVAKGRR